MRRQISPSPRVDAGVLAEVVVVDPGPIGSLADVGEHLNEPAVDTLVAPPLHVARRVRLRVGDAANLHHYLAVFTDRGGDLLCDALGHVFLPLGCLLPWPTPGRAGRSTRRQIRSGDFSG